MSDLIYKYINKKDGFTLVELMVVIGLIGVLSSVLIFLIDPLTYMRRSRDTDRKADLRVLQSVFEMHRSDEGSYPFDSAFAACDTGFTSGTTTYINNIPCDPSDDAAYVYTASPAGCDNAGTNCVSYILYACLEDVQADDLDDVDGGANDRCADADRVSFTVRNP